MSKSGEGSAYSHGLSTVRLRRMPQALRLNVSITTGRRDTIEAMKMVWLLPRSGKRWAGAFETLILPN